VNFGVPQQVNGRTACGPDVRISSADGKGAGFTGHITAVDSLVDEATRNVQAQATLPNPGGLLRPGMFVQAEVTLGGSSAVFPLPASAISYAPYGDSVFVVTELRIPTARPIAASGSSS
jgi:membrane fusion protein (multidrug efflux system)